MYKYMHTITYRYILSTNCAQHHYNLSFFNLPLFSFLKAIFYCQLVKLVKNVETVV